MGQRGWRDLQFPDELLEPERAPVDAIRQGCLRHQQLRGERVGPHLAFPIASVDVLVGVELLVVAGRQEIGRAHV